MKEWEEINIIVPWGHLSGKWYGSKLYKPILAIHGWQDNAGTFDTLIPLLPPNVSVLAIELPGHGLSSQLPQGIHYHASDFLFIIKIVMETYKWNTISILGHSLGAIMAFQFVALFPKEVDFVILLDALKPHITSPTAAIDVLGSTIENFLKLDKRNRSNDEPPSYTYEECVQKVFDGTFGSVKKQYAKYLLNRNLKKSKIYPNKYYFLRDGRLKVYEHYNQTQDVSKEMAKRINVPFMLIKAQGKSTTYYEKKQHFIEIVNLMKKYNPNFSFKEVIGTHHVHLCEPEKISKLINPFIEKYYVPSAPESIKSKL